MQTEYGVGETYPDSLTPTHCVSVGTYQFCLDREEVSGEKTTHEFVIVMKMQCIIIRNRSRSGHQHTQVLAVLINNVSIKRQITHSFTRTLKHSYTILRCTWIWWPTELRECSRIFVPLNGGSCIIYGVLMNTVLLRTSLKPLINNRRTLLEVAFFMLPAPTL
jgi:hypothetical protein